MVSDRHPALTPGAYQEVCTITDYGLHRQDRIEVVVDCVLVNYPEGSESRNRIVHAILQWAEEHPDEWEQFQERCQRRIEALV